MNAPDAGGVDVEVVEVVPGELDVVVAGRRCRVLVPAGVGVPGWDETELAGALVAELVEQRRQLPDVVDVSVLLRDEPGLLGRLLDRLERGD